jgi:hypothetical protein
MVSENTLSISPPQNNSLPQNKNKLSRHTSHGFCFSNFVKYVDKQSPTRRMSEIWLEVNKQRKKKFKSHLQITQDQDKWLGGQEMNKPLVA